MTWDHPSIGKARKGKGPATKKAKRRRQARREEQRADEAWRAQQRIRDRRHAPHQADDVHSTLAAPPRLGDRKKDRY